MFGAGDEATEVVAVGGGEGGGAPRPDVLSAYDAWEPETERQRAEDVPAQDRERIDHRLRGWDAVRSNPAVDDAPIEVAEERLDVRRAIGLVVEEVGVLVDVERDEWSRVPDRERVLGVPDVVEEALLVPVVGGPGPPPAAHPGGLQVAAPRLDRAEVALDERADRAVGIPSAST